MIDPITKNRLETFSDGVIAILITIMVLELRAPVGTSFYSIGPMLPTFLSYLLSFVYLAIYWNNHHHMLLVTRHINGRIMWANLHLLFWLSLFPFVTAWVGKTSGAAFPTALYGFVFLMAAVAFTLLQLAIINQQGPNSVLAKVIGNAWKEKLSLVLYALAIVCAFLTPWVSHAFFVIVALLWVVPDKRIERRA